MKRESALVFFLSLVCLLTASAAQSAGEMAAAAESKTDSLEERYIETRDGFIRRFSKTADPAEEGPALAELERQMRMITGPVRIEGFPEQGRINLPTLRPEPGFAQVDGLRFDSGREALFVTTEALLDRYLAERPELPKTLEELSRNGDFCRLVFHADAGVLLYAEIPVRSGEGRSFARAFLGAGAQDIGPFVPDEIFIFVSKGGRILLASAPAALRITGIPECRSKWDTFAKKSAEALDAYRSSQLKDRKAFDDSVRYREEGFETYRRCYGRAAQNQPFFTALKKQAQAIADRLQRD